MNLGSGFEILIEGRDVPKKESTNDHFADTDVTKQFSNLNNLDCWFGTAGTADSEGNLPDGVLFNSGLIMQVFDTSDNTFKKYSDLSVAQRETLKAQDGYTAVYSRTHVDQKRLTISKVIAGEGDYDFYIFYDQSLDETSLRIHPEEAVTNSNEHIT